MGVDDDDQARENFYTKIINDKIKTKKKQEKITTEKGEKYTNRQEQVTQECCISTNE